MGLPPFDDALLGRLWLNALNVRLLT
jgi:hypothetical protein